MIIEIVCVTIICKNDCEYAVQGINAAFGYNTASALNDDLNWL